VPFLFCGGYFFTTSKLLKRCYFKVSWTRFPPGFPQPSTGKSRRPQLLHKRQMFFCCGAQPSAPEWVQRIRGNSQSLPNDDCGDAGGSRQFSRVNCRGKLETRASANRLPGHCGLLYSPLLEQAGPLAAAGWQGSDSPNHGSAASTGKSGTLRERCRTGTVDSPLLAAGRQDERSTNDAARMAGPGRICF
jgi:hypothetical protein